VFSQSDTGKYADPKKRLEEAQKMAKKKPE